MLPDDNSVSSSDEEWLLFILLPDVRGHDLAMTRPRMSQNELNEVISVLIARDCSHISRSLPKGWVIQDLLSINGMRGRS